jgi:MFS family permease
LTEEEISSLTENRHSGFYYGYLIVALAFFIEVLVQGSIYSYGVFFKPLLGEFGWTRTMTSGAYSLFMFMHGFFYIVTGRLNDRFGPRLVISISGFSLGLGYLLMSQISAVWHLYLVYGVLIAAGAGGCFVPLMSTVARWFDKKRGLMTGIAASGLGVGTMVVPPIASWLIASYGWRTSYAIVGVVVLVVLIMVAQFLRRDPGQMQHLPDSRNKGQGKGLDLKGAGLSTKEALRTSQFWLFCAVNFIFALVIQTIMVHIVPHATGLGISATVAATIFIAIGGTSIAGRVAMGSACDRIGSRSVWIICFVLLPVALGCLLVAKEMWMFYFFAIIFGFSYGGLVAISSPFVAELFGLKSHGAIMGIAVFLATIGGAAGPVMAGRVFDVTSSYHLAFLIMLGVCVGGTILSFLIRTATRELGSK